MKRWPTKPLTEVAAVIRGVSFDKSQVSDEPRKNSVPVLRAGNIQESLLTDSDLVYVSDGQVSDEQRMRCGDLAICMSSGSPAIVGKSAHLEADWGGSVGAFCAIVRFNEKLHHRFGSYWFRSPAFMQWRDNNAKGANIQNLRRTELETLSIPVPPMAEQEWMVKLLDEADELWKLRVQADRRTATLIPALFHEMFGDPATNPKGFRKEPLEKLIRVKSGDSLPAKNMDVGGQFPVYGGNGINGHHSKFMFEQPVIVIGRVGVYCGVVHLSEPNSWVTDNALYVCDIKEDFDQQYLAGALRVANFNQYAGRAAQPLVSGNRIYPIPILIPPLPLQKEFAQRVTEIREVEAGQATSRTRLDALFQSMLHRAFHGDL